MKAKKISMAFMEFLLESDPMFDRKYYAVDNETGHVTALDVRNGEMFVEVFHDIDAALEWLAD